jgi:hypothetical protein
MHGELPDTRLFAKSLRGNPGTSCCLERKGKMNVWKVFEVVGVDYKHFWVGTAKGTWSGRSLLGLLSGKEVDCWYAILDGLCLLLPSSR